MQCVKIYAILSSEIFLRRGKTMYLIVGLGNPEPEYSKTRHNMGFDVINKLSTKYEIEVKKEKLEESILKLKVNDIYSRDKLVHELVIRGYKKVATTSTSGTFSVRGSLIDVYSINEQTPIRIYYFDDEIESIKKINVEKSRKNGKLPRKSV